MKKRTLTLLTVLFGLCLLIFACRREINTIIKPGGNVSSDLLESAKILDAQALSSSASLNAQTPGFINLKGQWDNAWTIDAGNRMTYLVVPTTAPTMSDRTLDVRRLFVFEAINNQVIRGKIIEFIGVNYRVQDQLNELIKHNFDATIGDFNGAIIHYDLNYRWLQGGTYLKGVQIYGNTVVVRTGSKDGTFYLAHFYANGNDGFDYAMTPQMNMFSRQLRTAGDGDATGSMGGTQSLPEVTIPGDPVGGNPGGVNPPPPTTPPVNGGGSGGTTPPTDPASLDTFTGTEPDEPDDDQQNFDFYYYLAHPKVNIVSCGSVTIYFGSSADGVSANQPVNATLASTLCTALAAAHLHGVNSILIKCTTNGVHTSSNSNHYKATAVDISQINGTAVAVLGNSALVQAMQNALDDTPSRRENFGPSFKHKNGSSFPTTDGGNHIHFSVTAL